MKTALLVVLAVLCGGAAGLFSNSAFGSRSTAESSVDADERAQLLDRIGVLNQTVTQLATRQQELERELEASRLASPTTSNRVAQLSAEDVAALVDRALNERAQAGSLVAATPGTAPGARGSSNGVAEAPLAELMEMLGDGETFGMAEEELWQEIRESGRIDEVLAEYERMAEMHPNNPDVQAELGTAYIQKIFDVGAGPLAGKYGTLADEAYDRALDIDPEHWDARFSKAVSLSNWPEFMGKTGEAIQEFETLIEQQEQRPVQDEYASTYFILGNMYQRKGDTEAALEAWRRGLALFPDSEQLREQIRMNE